MAWLVFALVAQAQFIQCGCLCVDGVPKTLCQTIEEARRQANVCPARTRCPPLEPGGADIPPQYFDAGNRHQ